MFLELMLALAGSALMVLSPPISFSGRPSAASLS